MPREFDYEKTIWGREVAIRGSLFSSGSFIMEGLLQAMSTVTGDVLDVGCGGGQFSQALQQQRLDLGVIGIDIGGKAIRYAKKKFSRVSFMVADARKLPFGDQRFAGVFSIETVEHIRETEMVIAEIVRVLKPCGVLYLSVSCEKSRWTIPGILGLLGIDLTRNTVGHVNKLSYNDLVRILQNHGFTIKRKFYFGHLIRQLEDLFYVLYLTITHKRPGDLWQEYVGDKSTSFKRIVLACFKLAILLTNIESRLLWWFPGISIQIEAEKR